MSTPNDRDKTGHNEQTRMFLESMKKVMDVIQVNSPIGGAFAFISLTELETISKIGAVIIGTICTILITCHKLKKKDDDEHS